MRDHVIPRPTIWNTERRYPGQCEFARDQHFAGVAHLLAVETPRLIHDAPLTPSVDPPVWSPAMRERLSPYRAARGSQGEVGFSGIPAARCQTERPRSRILYRQPWPSFLDLRSCHR